MTAPFVDTSAPRCRALAASVTSGTFSILDVCNVLLAFAHRTEDEERYGRRAIEDDVALVAQLAASIRSSQGRLYSSTLPDDAAVRIALELVAESRRQVRAAADDITIDLAPELALRRAGSE